MISVVQRICLYVVTLHLEKPWRSFVYDIVFQTFCPMQKLGAQYFQYLRIFLINHPLFVFTFIINSIKQWVIPMYLYIANGELCLLKIVCLTSTKVNAQGRLKYQMLWCVGTTKCSETQMEFGHQCRS